MVTTAYFHRPDEPAEEARAAGLDVLTTVTVEGTAWMLAEQDLDESLHDPVRREYLMWALRQVETDRSQVPAMPPVDERLSHGDRTHVPACAVCLVAPDLQPRVITSDLVLAVKAHDSPRAAGRDWAEFDADRHSRR